MAPIFTASRLDFTPTPQPDWTDCVYAQDIGVWLALSPQASGTADKVLRSTDGLTWTEEDLPTGANWQALVWSEEAGLFAAFNSNNSGCGIATSPDGITWTNRHAQQQRAISCTYGQSKFVAVGGQRQVIGPNVFGKANFALSGVGVSTRTVNVNMSVSTVMLVGIVGNTTDNVTGVTYNGVALTLVEKVQQGSDRWIYVFKLLNPSTGGSFALTVTFSATNQGSAIYYNGYSNAGDVLQSTTNTGTGSDIDTQLTTTYDECWLAQFSINAADSAGTDGTVGKVRQTSDGQGGTWADSNSTVLGIPQLTPPGLFTIDVNVTSSAWAAITVAFRPQVTEGLVRSSDGITWTEHEGPNATQQCVAYSPELNLFVSIAARFPSGASYTSTDGVNWSDAHAMPAQPSLSLSGNCGLVWADDLGIFVAVLEDGSCVKSTDGETWTAMTLPVGATIPVVLGVTWAKRLGLLIFFTEADSPGYIPLLYSEDGDTIVATTVITTEDTDGDWSIGVYSPVDDRMVAFPHFNDYAMLVEFGPHITEVDPPRGNVVGGETVNLIGSGFLDGMEVVFDNLFATDVVVLSPTLATCVVPPHLATGFVDVTVTNTDDRFDTGELLYEYTNGTDPETGEDFVYPGISWMGSGCAPGAIVPDHGTMEGGTPVTIFGRGFRAGSTVLFGGVPATSVFVDAAQPWTALVEAKAPEAWWRLEEASAALVLADETANDHDATLASANGKTSVRGGLSYSPTKGIALSSGSKGFAFDGSQAVGSFADLLVLAGPCTIEFLWTPEPAATAPTYGTVIGSASDQDGIFTYTTGGQRFISYESAPEGYSDQINTNPLTPGQTYHIALVLDGLGGGNWVIDGVLDAAVADVNLAGVLNCLFDVGGFPSEEPLLDEIAVYDTALSVATLLNHSDNRDADYPALVLADGAIAYWRCEEDDAANILEDSTGNGADATQAAGGRTSVPGGLDDGHVMATIAPTIPLSGAYSIEFLFNPTDSASVQALLVSLASLGFFINADRTLRAQVAHTVLSDVALAADAISHVVFTADGALARWYVNGVNHTSGAGTWDGTDDVTLARMLAEDGGGSPVVCNVLDEVVVHSVQLSPAEVLEHYVAAREWVSGTYITLLTPPHQTGPVDVEVISP